MCYYESVSMDMKVFLEILKIKYHTHSGGEHNVIILQDQNPVKDHWEFEIQKERKDTIIWLTDSCDHEGKFFLVLEWFGWIAKNCYRFESAEGTEK